MTEKEKAARGMLYNANYDPELIRERDAAKEILWEYNRLRPTQRAERERLIRSLLGAVGDGFVIEQPFQCDYGYNIEIGRNFYSNHNLVILDAAKVIIGDHVFIAPNVGIYTAGHPLDTGQRAEGLEYVRPVTIGDDVWIGGGVSILPGVHIGNGTTIGAGSVVTRSLPARVVAVGNPCRVIRSCNGIL